MAVGQQWLYSRRAPGNTCLSSLRAADPERFGEPAVNDSKGCGGVMRSAPFGRLGPTFGAEVAYRMASESAAYTHGHPTGQVASGTLAYLIANLVAGTDLRRSVDATVDFVAAHDPNGQTTRAVKDARRAAESATIESGESLGGGWIAEEALAIAVFCALRHPCPSRCSTP